MFSPIGVTQDETKKMSKDNNVEAVSSGDPQHRYPPPPPPPQQQYPPPQKGTFQVDSNNPPPPPQPVPPPVGGAPSAPQYYPHGNQQAYAPGYAVVGGRPAEPPLPCGIGFGWILFILGFFLGVIPWYIGAIILLCSKIDRREKPGCIACTIAAVIATILIIIIVITRAHG